MNGREAISIEDVRSLFIGVFDRISASGIHSVEIERATYWSVFPADIFAIEKPGPVLSDVVDDLSDLRSEIADPESPAAVGTPWHSLHHLAGLCSVLAAATLEPGSVRRGSAGGAS